MRLQGAKAAVLLVWSYPLLYVAAAAGTSPDLEACTRLLEYGSVYSAELDDPVQLAALLRFHNSTGGAYWKYDQPISTEEHLQFSHLVTELEFLGSEVADGQLNISSLNSDAAQDMSAALTILSQNCTLQQWLSFGQALLKFEWGTPGVSYCQYYGITCCKTAGDQLNQFCAGPQSVAQLYLQDTNLTGSIPVNFLELLEDLQSLDLSNNEGLTGRFPAVSQTACAKMSELRLAGTDLQQCNASHVAALKNNASAFTVHAGSSSQMGPDDAAGCLPGCLQFCQPAWANPESHLVCPPVDFNRPVSAPPNNLAKLKSFLNILSETGSLVAATDNVSTPVLHSPASGPGDRRRPPPHMGEGQPGPGQPDDGRHGPPLMQGCPADGFQDMGAMPGPGLGRPPSQVDIDDSFYSFVGCRCEAGYDNVYTIDNAGRVTLECEALELHSKLSVYVGVAAAGAAVLLLLVLLLALRWRQIIRELANLRLNRVKRGHIPGTLNLQQAQELGLGHKEVTLVMTDVQSSSKLWEWNTKVMDAALAMHDKCLRSVLHQYHGYEVSTEGDAFTLAFHDPIDAVAWALESQHRLLALPWPEELLSHEDAREQRSPPSIEGDDIMFRGLRVRMAMHTGQPESIQVHHVTRQVEYRGDLVSLTEALIGFLAGGQVLLSGATYQRIYGRLHNVTLKNSTLKALKFPTRKQPEVQVLYPAGSSLDTRFAPELTLPSQPSLEPSSPTGSPASPLFLAGPPDTPTSAVSRSELAQLVVQPAEAMSEFAGMTPKGRAASRRRAWVLHGMWSLLSKLPRKQRGKGNQAALREWGPSQTDASTMVTSLVPEQPGECILVDMGAFHLAEFAHSLGRPYEGSAVHGGIHVLQMCSSQLISRMLMFPRLPSTVKIAPTFADAPGVARDASNIPGVWSPPSNNLQATMVFCSPAQYKELVQQNVQAAEAALRQFQSCVRTTLLLSSGYECQEKDGLFMIAFTEARGAVEWAVLLQFALLSVDWSPTLEHYSCTAEVKSKAGQTLFKGFTAQVGLVHGSMEKVCPHTSTGRADYFGTTVNRAARLLSATKPGQILVEAPVMEIVLQQWRRNASTSGSAVMSALNSTAQTGPAAMTKGAALLQAGIISIPDIAADNAAEELVTSPRTKSAPQLLHTFSQKESDLESASSPHTSRGAAEASDPVVTGQKSWFVRPSGGIKAVGSGNRGSRHGVTFAPASERPSTGLSKLLGQRRSTEGVGYDDAELDELEVVDASCQPVAAGSALTIGNCHMLKFLAQQGQQRGRQESVLGPKPAPGLGSSLTPLSGSPELSQASLPGLLTSRTACDNSLVSPMQEGGNPGSKRCSFLNPQQREAKPVWTPGSVQGKPFGTIRVPIEVWGIGAFRFKGISGHSKVMEVQPAELAERMNYHDAPLEAGKATCLLAARYRRCIVNIQLMDVLNLQLSL